MIINFKIYVLKEPDNKTIRYVGLTKQPLKQRFYHHLRDRDKTHKASWIKSLKKKGINPIMELLLENLTFEEAIKMEKLYIKKFKEEGYDLTNHSLGGEGSYGYKWTDAQRKKLSESQKERFKNNPLSNGHRRDVFQFTKDGSFIKKYISSREAERITGSNQSNIIECCLGYRKATNKFLWSYTDKPPIVDKNKHCRSILQYSLDWELICEFESINFAAIATKCSQGNISSVCIGSRSKAGGFIWRYKK